MSELVTRQRLGPIVYLKYGFPQGAARAKQHKGDRVCQGLRIDPGRKVGIRHRLTVCRGINDTGRNNRRDNIMFLTRRIDQGPTIRTAVIWIRYRPPLADRIGRLGPAGHQ